MEGVFDIKKYILSISFCYHDSAITISDNNKILLHLEYERISRIKHDRFKNLKDVETLVNIGLTELSISINDIEEVLITKWNNLFIISKQINILGKNFTPVLTSHHENHIGTALPSKFKNCVILCSDGGSEDGDSKLYYKKGEKIYLIENLDDKPFTGKFYGTIAQMIVDPKGSTAHNSGVGKLMGLSSYGKYDSKIMELLSKNIEEINILHFENVDNLLKKFSLTNSYEKIWENELRQNIAYNAHKFWVDSCVQYLKKHNNFSKNICLVGGCALNISLNSELIDKNIYENVYVSPISTDAGQSLGAILYHNRNIKCNYPYLGRGKESNYLFDEDIIEELIDNKIIAWYQGRAEIGARALGHRSFLGLPLNVSMRKKISEEIKGREPYRPVAAIIPLEFVKEYFEQDYDSPYMTFCAKAKEITKRTAPAIVHVDGTTRVQTLTKKDNPVLYSILYKLKDKGFPPILMNTSLNVMGEPIVDNFDDLKKTFLESKADSLYIDGTKYYEEKLVTLIIPTYNNDNKLEMLLNSLEKHHILNDKKIEVIVVQNYHEKKAFIKTKANEKKYNVKVFHEPNQGKSCALNKGIKKANGKYIVSTDDDIIITDSRWLYKFVKEFEKNPNLGYCSGKVSMYNKTSNIFSEVWEKKGGLSKGEKPKYWSQKNLTSFKHKIIPWKLHKICAGANQMIPKKVLLEIGGYSEFLGKNGNVDGLTLEIGYKIAKIGYDLMYNPNVEIYHQHPRSEEDIKKKLYYYGMQDTGVSMYIFLKFKDYRYLWWAIIGHPAYTIKKIVKRIFKRYNLPINYIICGLRGNLNGWRLCLKNYIKFDEGD